MTTKEHAMYASAILLAGVLFKWGSPVIVQIPKVVYVTNYVKSVTNTFTVKEIPAWREVEVSAPRPENNFGLPAEVVLKRGADNKFRWSVPSHNFESMFGYDYPEQAAEEWKKLHRERMKMGVK